MSDVTTVDSYVDSSYSLPQLSDTQTLDKQAFLELLVAEMQNQDPLEPMSNTEFITQMAQLSTFEAIDNLSTQFSVNAGLTSLYTATNLVGKQVTYTDSETEESITGTVDEVTMVDGEFYLVVDGVEVGLGDVTSIMPEEETDDTSSDDDDDDDDDD